MGPASCRKKPAALVLLALLVGGPTFFLSFATNWDGAFVHDDLPNIVENPAVTEFDPGVAGAWSRAAFDSPATLRPIPYLSFAWQWYLWGGNRMVFHAANDFLHGLAAVALFFLLLEVLRTHPMGGPQRREGPLIAAAGALLWAFHPVQTSSVTYLVQRMAVLSGLFEFLAFGLYLRARRRESGWAYGGAALAYFLALFSKESAATLPVLIGLYEWLLAPSEPSRRRRARAIALGIACLPPLAMALFYALDSPQHFSAGLLPGRDFTLFQRVLSAPRMYGRYLALLAFPYPQALDYWLQASRSVLHPWTTLPATLALVGLLGAVLVKRQKAPVVCFAAMGFLVALGPESTFLNLEFFYEHRLYVASAFVVPLVPAGLGLWVSRQEGRGRRLAVALFCLLMAACAVRSGLRNREWRDPLLLWQKTLEVRPHNPRALLSVGLLLERRGEVTSAEEHFRRAIVAGPTLPLPHYDLGNLLARRGKLGEAITHYRQATSLDPKYSGAWHNLANALALAGDLEGAAAAYRRALRLDPDLLVAYEQLAAVLSRLGRGNGDEVAHLKQRYLERSCALGHAGACRHMGKDARGPKGLAP